MPIVEANNSGLSPNLDTEKTIPTHPTEEKFPTVLVELPSKGLLYPADHPLRSGKIEMSYMTTKEEDILSTPSYISDGTVLDRLFKSMIVTKFNYDDLLLGDRNAIMIWARILGYGPEYNTKIVSPNNEMQPVTVDLNQVKNKEISYDFTENEFKFTLPTSKHEITFKLMTVGMQKDIDAYIQRIKKMQKTESENLTTRLRYMIQSVNGNTDRAYINNFVPKILAIDSRALREYIQKIQPDVDLTIEAVEESTGKPFQSNFQLGLDLFWPDYK